jgi:hypothetical protein
MYNKRICKPCFRYELKKRGGERGRDRKSFQLSKKINGKHFVT